MIIAILGLLGVPLWLLLGWLAAGIWHRHQIKELPGLFNVKVRLISGSHQHLNDNFPRSTGHAMWAHDVLIMEKGMLIPRTIHFEVADSVGQPSPVNSDKVKHVSDDWVTMQFSLDDGTVIELAVPDDAAEAAQGPFFAGPNQYSDQPAPGDTNS